MKPCQDRKEMLMLDVFGELEPDERSALEAHIEQCEGCRQERDKLILFLEGMKGVIAAPDLSTENSRALALSLKKKLGEEKEKGWNGKRLFTMPKGLIYAVSAACLLIVVMGWFTMREIKITSPSSTVSNVHQEVPLILKDLDIIKNLELLEEMETIEKLVQRVETTDVM